MSKLNICIRHERIKICFYYNTRNIWLQLCNSYLKLAGINLLGDKFNKEFVLLKALLTFMQNVIISTS